MSFSSMSTSSSMLYASHGADSGGEVLESPESECAGVKALEKTIAGGGGSSDERIESVCAKEKCEPVRCFYCSLAGFSL
jgi:hypothetical protein